MKKLFCFLSFVLAVGFCVSMADFSYIEAETTSPQVTRLNSNNFETDIEANPSGSFELSDDITLSSTFDSISSFSGTLDGNGYSIKLEEPIDQNGITSITVSRKGGEELSGFFATVEGSASGVTDMSYSLNVNGQLKNYSKTLTGGEFSERLDLAEEFGYSGQVKPNVLTSNIELTAGTISFEANSADEVNLTFNNEAGYSGSVDIVIDENTVVYLDNGSEITLSALDLLSIDIAPITNFTTLSGAEGSQLFDKDDLKGAIPDSSNSLLEQLFGYSSLHEIIDHIDFTNEGTVLALRADVTNHIASPLAVEVYPKEVSKAVELDSGEEVTFVLLGERADGSLVYLAEKAGTGTGDEAGTTITFDLQTDVADMSLLEGFSNYYIVNDEFEEFVVNSTMSGQNNLCLDLTLSYIDATSSQSFSHRIYINDTEGEIAQKIYFADIEGFSTASQPQNVGIMNVTNTAATTFATNAIFNEINGATIRNLAVEDFALYVERSSSSASSSSSLGILANSIEGATLENIEVSGELVASFDYSANVGALAGTSVGSQIKNVAVAVSMDVTQTNHDAQLLNVGGMFGRVQNGTLTNVYVASSSSAPTINVEVIMNSSILPTTTVNVGGMVGSLAGGIFVNNFTNAVVTTYHANGSATVRRGSIIGYVDEITAPLNLSYILYMGAESDFVGNIQNSSITGARLVTAGEMNAQSTYLNSNYFDTENYAWDFDKTWSVGATSLPSLQPFDTFYIYLNPKTYTTLSIDGAQYDEDQGGYMARYGAAIKITSTVSSSHEIYYILSGFQRAGVTLSSDSNYTISPDFSELSFEVNALTAGTYTNLITSNSFALRVEVAEEDSEMGGVRIQGYQTASSQSLTSNLTYGAEARFEALASSSSYLFEKWVWVSEDGAESDVYYGMDGNVQATSPQITVLFMERPNEGALDNVIYIQGTPSQSADPSFTLRAKFTSNIVDLKIRSTLPAEDCVTILVDDASYSFDSSTTEYLVERTIMKDRNVTITVEVREGYEFVGWRDASGRTLEGTIVNYFSGIESEPTITIRTNEALTLEAEVRAIEADPVDLTWLWWTLGGIGAAGLITLVVVLIVKRSKNDGYLNGWY